MSSEHKRPLYAFVVVALLCALFVGNGLRSEALTGILRVVEAPTQGLLEQRDAGRTTTSDPGEPGARAVAPERVAADEPVRAEEVAPQVRDARGDAERHVAQDRQGASRTKAAQGSRQDQRQHGHDAPGHGNDRRHERSHSGDEEKASGKGHATGRPESRGHHAPDADHSRRSGRAERGHPRSRSDHATHRGDRARHGHRGRHGDRRRGR